MPKKPIMATARNKHENLKKNYVNIKSNSNLFKMQEYAVLSFIQLIIVTTH